MSRKNDEPVRFVALPYWVLEQGLSAGEFLTLTLLCGHADRRTGRCFVYQRTMAKRAGVSKATVSRWISGLRKRGLVRTETTRNAAGFNSHLNYFVEFWPSWHAQLGSRSVASAVDNSAASSDDHSAEEDTCPSEQASYADLPGHQMKRSVSEVERKDNQIQDNKNLDSTPDNSCDRSSSPSPLNAIWLDRVLSNWKARLRTASGYEVFVPQALISQTETALSQIEDTQKISRSDTEAHLKRMWRDLAVAVEPGQLSGQVATIHSLKHGVDAALLGDLSEQLKAQWKPYWRRPPSPSQFNAAIQQSVSNYAKRSPSIIRNLLQGYLKRARPMSSGTGLDMAMA